MTCPDCGERQPDHQIGCKLNLPDDACSACGWVDGAHEANCAWLRTPQGQDWLEINRKFEQNNLPDFTSASPEGTTGHVVDPAGVNHPAHYNLHPSGVECIDIVRHHNFNVGSAIKYLWRQGLKDGEPSEKDVSKAIWYLQNELERMKGRQGD